MKSTADSRADKEGRRGVDSVVIGAQPDDEGKLNVNDCEGRSAALRRPVSMQVRSDIGA